MREQQQQAECQPPQQPATASEPVFQPNGEEDPSTRQLGVVENHSITDLARRLGVEEQQAQYPWEDFGEDIDESIVDMYGDDEEEWFSEETLCAEEGYYLDSVYYTYPKSAADRYRYD